MSTGPGSNYITVVVGIEVLGSYLNFKRTAGFNISIVQDLREPLVSEQEHHQN